MIDNELIDSLMGLLEDCGNLATDTGRDILSNRCGRMITALKLASCGNVVRLKKDAPVFPPCDTEPAA